MKLTLADQRRLYAALPASKKSEIKRICKKCGMRGDGFFDVMKSIGKALGGVAKEIGPTVLKEIIVPLIANKINNSGKQKGKGLRLAGGSAKKKKPKRKPKKGSGLKLAGRR